MSDARNTQFTRQQTFTKQHVLNHAPRDLEAENRALVYLDKHAPDLVGMVMGHVL